MFRDALGVGSHFHNPRMSRLVNLLPMNVGTRTDGYLYLAAKVHNSTSSRRCRLFLV